MKAEKGIRKQQWMTEEILERMEEQRKHKNKNERTYKEISKSSNNIIKKAKEL